MTTAPPTAEDAPHWARPLYERRIDMLGRMAEAGLELALTVKDHVQALVEDGGVEPAVIDSLSRPFAGRRGPCA